MRTKIIRAILLSLLKCDGLPIDEDALVSAVYIVCRQDSPTESDIVDRMKDLATEGYISGVTNELTKERTWTLTEKGTHNARQLR